MIILDGKKIADRILDELKNKVARLPRPPVLVIVTVNPNEATKSYLRAKKRAAEGVGIGLQIRNYKSGVRGLENQIIKNIESLNDDPAVDAIMVQLPLPSKFDRDKVLSAIAPPKDVEKEALTPKAILRLLDEYKISIKGKQVVIVGAGFLVGRPLAKLMEKAGAKIDMIDTYPKTLDKCKMPSVTKEADILISCCGCSKIITAEMVKPGAVVIDCGSPEGDVDCEKISKIASAITPVPGGVGPMTVAMLMEKTVRMALKT